MILYVLFALFIGTLEILARREEKNNKNFYKKNVKKENIMKDLYDNKKSKKKP
jgi:hypothetical protein